MATSLPPLPPLTGDTSWIDNPTGMEGLPTPIAPPRPSGSAGSTSSTWSDWPPKAPSAPSSPSTGILPKWLGHLAAGTFEAYIGLSLEDIIFIVVGLILVAAAVFTFKDVQQGVQTVVKTAGRAAEVAA